MTDDPGSAFDAIAAVPAPRLAAAIGAQAPQVAAAILLLVPGSCAAAVLDALPEDIRHGALRAMVATRPAGPAACRAMAGALHAAVLEPAGVPDRSAEVAAIIDAMAPAARGPARTALAAKAPTARHAAARPSPVLRTVSRLPPGLAAVVAGHGPAAERLPMLDVVADHLARGLESRLRSGLARPVGVALTALRSVRFGDWLAGRDDVRSLFAVAEATEWGHPVLVLPDRLALDAWIDALAGGTATLAGPRPERRPLTAIDRALASLAYGMVLDALGAAFAPVAAVTFRLDRLVEDGHHAAVERPAGAVCVVDLSTAVDGCPGRLEVVLPYAALAPVRDRLRDRLRDRAVGYGAERDARWDAHLRAAVARADAPVCAVAGTAEVPVAALLAWAPGTVLVLDGDGSAVLETDGAPLAHGAIAIRSGRWAIRVGVPGRVADLPLAAVAPPPPPAGAADPLQGVPVTVAAVLGHGSLRLVPRPGGRRPTVILDRAVEAPVAVRAAGHTVAHGTLVRVGDALGVRLSAVASSVA